MTSAIDTLRRDFDGDIIEPGDAEYEAARSTVLAPGRPACVLRPRNLRDVQEAVRLAAAGGFSLSVRGGGHGFTGFGTNDGGIVIDLSHLATIEITDKEHHHVRIGGGATWGQVAAVLAPYGLAISSGDTKTVGVGGLTLAGGIGWKVRRYGLALDSVVAVEMVTAGGAVVTASADENAELFWAVRGGGGTFGIVTAFEFVAHPTTDLYFGAVAFPASQAAGVLDGWANYVRTAPDELTSTVDAANPFDGGPEAPVRIHVAIDGDDPHRAARLIDPIRRLGTVIADDIALRPYADTLEDGSIPPPGFRFVPRNAFVDHESVPAVLRILADVREARWSPFIFVRSLGGALSRIPADATAYAHRRAELMVMTVLAGPKPLVDAGRAAVDEMWQRLAPHVNGAYANFLASATEEDTAAIYPRRTRQRLAAVKRRYDPGNLFAGNHRVLLPADLDRPGGIDRRTETGSIESQVPPQAFVALLSDPSRIPDWAPGFADVITGNAESGWRARKNGHDFAVRVVVGEAASTIDYLREIAPGHEGGAHIRAIPRPGGGSVVVMTIPVRTGTDPATTAATLQEELTTLVGLASVSRGR